MSFKRVTIGPWQFTCDPEETSAIYGLIRNGNPEYCRCWGCLNYAAVRNEIHPPNAISVMEQLGVDYFKETDLVHTGIGLYEGWYHFVGVPDESGPEFYDIDDHYRVSITHQSHNPMKEFGNLPIAQLNFFVKNVRWTLSTSEQNEFEDDDYSEDFQPMKAFDAV